MKRYLILVLLVITTFQFSCFLPEENFPNTVLDDHPFPIIAAYYDLRDRSSYIQVTNPDQTSKRIHVQIFQHDNDCREINFFDDLTPNDTVVYDLDNIIRNNGSDVPANLNDNSYGFVVVSSSETSPFGGLIGNFRIVDNAGYEYRSNMGLLGFFPFEFFQEVVELNNFQNNPTTLISDQVNNLYANFNTVDNARYADVVGFSYTLPTRFTEGPEPADEEGFLTVKNYSDGVAFDIFVLDMNEEPLSCDSRVFACGGVMNYGINEDYVNSRDGSLLCPGGGLADPNGGFISFENGRFVNYTPPQLVVIGEGPELGPDIGEVIDVPLFIGLIGLNNGDGTGSMDYWFSDEGILFDVMDGV